MPAADWMSGVPCREKQRKQECLTHSMEPRNKSSGSWLNVWDALQGEDKEMESGKTTIKERDQNILQTQETAALKASKQDRSG